MLDICPVAYEPPPKLMAAGRLTETYAVINNVDALSYETYSAHTLRSWQAIHQTAVSALKNAPSNQPRTAVILGTGNCFDIPLPEIIDSFDSIALVDVDTGSTERALSDLSVKELGKVSLVGADVTGIMTEFGSSLHKLADKTPNISTFVTAASGIIESINPSGRQPHISEDFSFVCSQLLLSQLGLPPKLYLDSLLREKYGTSLSCDKGGMEEPMVRALSNLTARLQTSHIHYLAQLARREGAVHFADTYTVGVDTPDAPPIIPMVFDHLIAPIIDEHFSEIAARKGWLWKQPSGKLFTVVSHSLTPK